MESSSEGRTEALSVGELGRDFGESKGDELSKIDCKTGIAIVLDWREGREASGEDGEEMEGAGSEANSVLK